MSESQPAPPKVGQPDWQSKKAQKSDKPWLGWAGLWFGAGWLAVSFSRLVTVTTNYQVEQILNASGGTMILVAFFLACVGLPNSFSKRGRGNDESKPYGAITALLIMAGSALTLVAAAVLATQESLETAIEAEVEALGWHQHSFAEGRFSVQTPETWQPTENHIENREVCLVDRATELDFMALFRLKQNAGATRATEFAKLRVDHLSEMVADMQADEPTVSYVGGSRVVDVTVTGTSNGEDAAIHLRYLENGDAWGELIVWTSPTMYIQHQDTIMRVLNSVRVRQ